MQSKLIKKPSVYGNAKSCLISPRIIGIERNKITQIADLARDDASILRLWIGEGDVATPNFISSAAKCALDAGATRYTYALGLPVIRKALSHYHQRHWGVSIDPDRFAMTVGGMNAFMQACQALLEPDDEVLVPSPAWPNLFEAIRIVGGRPVPVPFQIDAQGDFTLPLSSLYAAVTSRTRAIIINSPSNPTGWIMSKAEMRELLDYTRERGLWLISDEVYSHFTYDGAKATSFLELAESDDRLLVTNTFSKNWAMTGWRSGWIVFPDGMQEIFENLGQFNTTGIPTFIQHAATVALNEGDKFIKDFVERCAESREILCNELGKCPGIRVGRPAGTFYLMLKLQDGSDSLSLALRMLREAKVGLAPGVAFGPGGESLLRLCFGIAPTLAVEAAKRISGFFRDTIGQKSYAGQA